jgi:hypothetical protein
MYWNTRTEYFCSTKTNTFTCDLSCKRCVDCVQCNAHLYCTISSVGSVCMVHTTTQLGPKPPHCRGFYVDHTQLRHTHTHTHTRRAVWTSYQPVAEAATSTTHNKHKRWTSVSSEGFECAIPTIHIYTSICYCLYDDMWHPLGISYAHF